MKSSQGLLILIGMMPCLQVLLTLSVLSIFRISFELKGTSRTFLLLQKLSTDGNYSLIKPH